MCTSDLSLKLIAAACLLIIFTDSFVLQQIMEKEELIHLTSDPAVYASCYKPQIRMRIIFTAYAILSSAICLVLTMAVMCCEEFSQWFDKIVNAVAEFMYLAFGPVLFTFCLIGLYSVPELAHECHPTYVSNNLNLMDVTILLVCLGLSFCITFIYALQYTNQFAEKELGDEHSAMYQLFSTYLQRQRHSYHENKRRHAGACGSPGEPPSIFANLPEQISDRENDVELALVPSETDNEDGSRISGSSESMPLKFNRDFSSPGSNREIHQSKSYNMDAPEALIDPEDIAATDMSFTEGINSTRAASSYTGL